MKEKIKKVKEKLKDNVEFASYVATLAIAVDIGYMIGFSLGRDRGVRNCERRIIEVYLQSIMR